MMKTFIITLGRAARQLTVRTFPDAQLVVNAEEENIYRQRYSNVLALPEGVRGIGHIRQWLLENAGCEKVLMLDDDLTFLARRTDDPTKFRQLRDGEPAEILLDIEKALDKYAMVGVTAREGGNRMIMPFSYATRIIRLLAFNAPRALATGARFNRLTVMEDFDFTLQLLRAGECNLVLNRWAQGQRSSNESGGCSTYRSMDKQHESAVKLQQLHPDFVRLVTKKTAHAWNGQERTDVVISWKKAFTSSGQELPNG